MSFWAFFGLPTVLASFQTTSHFLQSSGHPGFESSV